MNNFHLSVKWFNEHVMVPRSIDYVTSIPFYWWQVDFKEAFKGGVSAKRDIIACLAHCKEASIAMVTEFCQ